MAPPTPLQSAEPNSLSDDPTSTTSTNTSSVRRSGRHSAKIPVTYYHPANKDRRNANSIEKRQKISDTSPPDSSGKNSPTANQNPTPNTHSDASRMNPSNQSPLVTHGNKNITGTHLQTASQMSKRDTPELCPALYSKNPFYKSSIPAPLAAPDNEAPLLRCHSSRAGIPSFTPIQIRNILRFNTVQVSRRHVRTALKPSLPTVTEDMFVETHDLRTLVRAAAYHYASLPRKYGNPESCLPHLYKTFIPTAKFESWVKESDGGIEERDIHIVLMAVFEVVFLGWFSRVEAEEKIWELLGFEEEVVEGWEVEETEDEDEEWGE